MRAPCGWTPSTQLTLTWVEIITWNDFVEGSYVSPIDDPVRYEKANDLGASAVQPVPLHYFHSHHGATQLLTFFIQWYKTGHQPPDPGKISVFWAYHAQLSDPAPNRGPLTRTYGPIGNAVYVTANLTASAVLRISIGNTSQSITLPVGSTDLQLPLVAGPAPRFALSRGKLTRMAGAGDDAISKPVAGLLRASTIRARLHA